MNNLKFLIIKTFHRADLLQPSNHFLYLPRPARGIASHCKETNLIILSTCQAIALQSQSCVYLILTVVYAYTLHQQLCLPDLQYGQVEYGHAPLKYYMDRATKLLSEHGKVLACGLTDRLKKDGVMRISSWFSAYTKPNFMSACITSQIKPPSTVHTWQLYRTSYVFPSSMQTRSDSKINSLNARASQDRLVVGGTW